METEQPLNLFDPEPNPHETKDRFFKLIIGTAAGFVFGRIAENLYEAAVTKYRANRL